MRFLKLASNRLGLPADAPFVYPYAVDVSPSGRMVAFSEGAGHSSAGGAFTLTEALAAQWRGHIASAGADWLLPYLRLLSEGEAVPESELVARFIEIHGVEPETYDWNVTAR